MADAGVIETLRQAGAPDEVIAAAEAARGGSVYQVWAENWPSLELFLDLSTSWAWAGGGMGPPQRVGIPATEIQAALCPRGLRRKRQAALYDDIRTMERAALEVLREA